MYPTANTIEREQQNPQLNYMEGPCITGYCSLMQHRTRSTSDKNIGRKSYLASVSNVWLTLIESVRQAGHSQ